MMALYGVPFSLKYPEESNLGGQLWLLSKVQGNVLKFLSLKGNQLPALGFSSEFVTGCQISSQELCSVLGTLSDDVS